MNNNTGTVLGLLAGTAVGAIIGILYAPDKGTNTRRMISEKANEAKDQLAQSASHLKNNMMDSISTKKESLDSKLDQIVTDAGYKTEEVIAKLEAKLKDLKGQAKKAQKTS